MDRLADICENPDTLVYVGVLDLAQVASITIRDHEQIVVNGAQRTPDNVLLLLMDNALCLALD